LSSVVCNATPLMRASADARKVSVVMPSPKHWRRSGAAGAHCDKF
jgi:hypothetical protein